MNLFEYEDYKKLIQFRMEQVRKDFGMRFTYEKMAEFCGLQKTYLSKVLNYKGDLNGDQLYRACEYLKLTDSETEYVLLVREWQLANYSSRKKALQAKLVSLRRQQARTLTSAETSQILFNEKAAWEYHSDFELQLIHVGLTISRFARDPSLLVKDGLIGREILGPKMMKLSDWGLIDVKKKPIQVNDINSHLPEDSPMLLVFRLIHRLKALEFLHHREVGKEKNDNYSLSVIFSADKKFQSQFRSKLVKLVKEAHKQVRQTDPSVVLQLNIDLLEWLD